MEGNDWFWTLGKRKRELLRVREIDDERAAMVFFKKPSLCFCLRGKRVAHVRPSSREEREIWQAGKHPSLEFPPRKQENCKLHETRLRARCDKFVREAIRRLCYTVSTAFCKRAVPIRTLKAGAR